ncbi:hypothetical protein [Glacieibacterium sp.]|uniref:hypothetical protein n=1 Tax=Glacieibacterium sp. TaxID=2860237 RepID=UPI003AFFEC11
MVAANPAQAEADDASTAYATCVDKAAAAVDLSAAEPGTLADLAMKSCIEARGNAVAKLAAAQQAAGKDAPTAALVAERSMRLADSQLRDHANTAIVTRKLSDKKAV